MPSITYFGQCICQLEQFIPEAIREHGKADNGNFTVLLLICTNNALQAFKYGTYHLRA